MTKNAFEVAYNAAISNENRKGFEIATNIAVGRGINGTDYTTFNEKYESSSNTDDEFHKRTTKVVTIGEDYVELEVYRYNRRYRKVNEYTQRVFLPLENIVCVAINI